MRPREALGGRDAVTVYRDFDQAELERQYNARATVPDVQPYLASRTFGRYVAENRISRCRVELEPGDIYFFNSLCVHEVPAVRGKHTRIVLAVFAGYSEGDEEIFVWS